MLCSFVIRFDVREYPEDDIRVVLPLLLAASGFALAFDGFPAPDRPLTWIPAPSVRDCVQQVLTAARA